MRARRLDRSLCRGSPERLAQALVVAAFLVLATVMVFVRPPWEGTDEPDHVRNVESIVRGSLYPIGRGHGLEAVQPPLYYALLAGWQEIAGERATTPHPVQSRGCALAILAGGHPRCWLYRHDLPGASSDRRLVDLLRLPGVLLGTATILFTAAAAGRLSHDRWTPVVACAIVAFVPTFVFVSTGVNNDVLAIALASAATWLGVVLVTGTGRRGSRKTLAGCAALAVVLAALVQTKLTGALLVPAGAAGVWWAAKRPAMRVRMLAAFAACGALVSGWWLVHNTSLYGDPLALAATSRVNRELGGPLEYGGVHPLQQVFVEVPKTIWKQFWYAGVYVDEKFEWPWWAYLPFWCLTALGLGGLALRLRGNPHMPRGALAVLFLFVVGGLLAVWIIGFHDRLAQARLAFVGLPALACLIALGGERLRLVLGLRVALPAICLAATLVAIFTDVVAIPG